MKRKLLMCLNERFLREAGRDHLYVESAKPRAVARSPDIAPCGTPNFLKFSVVFFGMLSI
jgi:hypothetical protein